MDFRPAIVQQDPSKRRMEALAAMLQSQPQPQARTFLEGLGNMAQQLSKAYMLNKSFDAEENKQKSRQQTLSSAIDAYGRSQQGGETKLSDGDTITWNKATPDQAKNVMASILASNSDTADQAMQMRMDDFNRQQDLQNEIDKTKALQPIEIETARQKWAIDSQMTPYQREQVDLDRKKFEAEQNAPKMPFEGTGMDAQAMNILLRGDPATPEYRAAWSHLAQPKVTIDQQTGGMTVVTPDMSAYRPPGDATAMPQPTYQNSQQQTPAGPSIQYTPGDRPNFNDTQGKAAGFADRMAASNSVLSTLESQGTDIAKAGASKVPVFGNYMVGGDYQRFDQAKRDFINAQLRRESGAVINPEEFANAEKQYFPQPGDGPEVLQQKSMNREIAIKAMQRDAGPSYKPTNPPGTNNDTDPIEEELRKRGVLQ
ncbi:MAG: hypothetical protein GC149_20330 [Gammaproteobacteria bacterium]|nr:hypothetical protein [Gammaproteobacteria bacterium]